MAGASLCALASLLAPIHCAAQLCQTTHTTNLYCLLPTAFRTPVGPFTAFFTPFGTELGELPTARPGGLVLTFEKGVLVPSTESLGTIFTERPEALGKRRIFLGFTYQNFGFGSIDGNRLRDLPIVLFDPLLDVYTVTENRINVRAGQYTAVAAVGLTKKLDVALAVPFEHVALAASVHGTEYGIYGATASVDEYVPGRSFGLSDIVAGAKYQLPEWKRLRSAFGADVRLPTGDELNFLGSGTPGLKPYFAFSSHSKVSPHGNVGFQWNGHSILNTNAYGGKQQLPPNLLYTAGADFALTKRMTLFADLLGRRYYHAPRLQSASASAAITVPGLGSARSVEPYTGSYSSDDLGLGFKAQTLARFILSGNVLLKLDDGGLRAKVVPLGGLSYSF